MAVASILIVEDERTVLRALERAMRLAGYKVAGAETADDAISLCDEHTFDLVILDYLMPSMKGLELLTRIRKVQPLVRSVLISGKLDSEFDEDTLASDLRRSVEVDVYLHKPVPTKRLKDEVERLLAESSSGDWKAVADRTLKAQSATIKHAREVTKQVDKLRKKR